MAKHKVKVIDGNIDHDVELCRVTNARVVRRTMQLLVEQQIPFTQNWKRIPFFLRERYKGANEICIIKTHPNHYHKARKVLDQMEVFYRKRIVVHAC